MSESRASKLTDLTTTEIAEAVDAAKYHRGFHCCHLSIARKGALSWFLFQYLLLFQVNLLAILAITICLLIFELHTNHLTMKAYSTHEIVDLLMKRTTLDASQSNFLKILGLGFCLWSTGFILCVAGASFYSCHAMLFFGAFVMLCALKSGDLMKRIRSMFFEHSETPDGRVYLQVVHSPLATEFFCPGHNLSDSVPYVQVKYAGLVMAVAFPFLVFLSDGLVTIEGMTHLTMIVPVVFSAFGCLTHEPARFHLVQRELDRMSEGLEQSRQGAQGGQNVSE